MLTQRLLGYAVTNVVYAIFSALFGLTTDMPSFQYPAYKQIDRRGRRFLLLLSLLGMTFSLLTVAFCFQISGEKPSLRIGLITFSVIVFTFFYAFGAGPVP